MNACLNDEEGVEDQISEMDLVLTRINNGKQMGTIRVTKAEIVEPSEPEPPVSTSSLFGNDLNGRMRSTGSFSTSSMPPMSAQSLNVSVSSDLNDSFASAPCEILLPPMIEDTPQMTRPRFKQYVDNGCEIDLCFAIDFTSSNGTSMLCS